MMYTSTHTPTGGILGILCPPLFLLYLLLSFSSHRFVDMLQEKPYPEIQLCVEIIFLEIFLIGTYLICGGFTLLFWMAFMGGIAANLMDIIDKFRKYILKKNEIFACHQDNFNHVYTFKTEIGTILFSTFITAIYFLLLAVSK